MSSTKEGTYNLDLKASTSSFSTILPLTIIVKTLGFTISATPKEVSLKPFEAVSINLQINRLSIGDAPVTVKLKTDLSEITSTPTTITGNQGTLELTSTSDQEGTFDLTLEATSNEFTKLLLVTVNVTSQPIFVLRNEPTNLNLKTGASSTATLFIDRQNGFDQSVAVQASNVPSGVSGSSVTIPSGQSQGQFTFSASTDAPEGTYLVTLTATSDDGNISDSSTIDLRDK